MYNFLKKALVALSAGVVISLFFLVINDMIFKFGGDKSIILFLILGVPFGSTVGLIYLEKGNIGCHLLQWIGVICGFLLSLLSGLGGIKMFELYNLPFLAFPVLLILESCLTIIGYEVILILIKIGKKD